MQLDDDKDRDGSEPQPEDGGLAPAPDDFPEQEIATRWVKQRKDSLCIVWVSRSSTGKEVYEMIRGYWKDCINKF